MLRRLLRWGLWALLITLASALGLAWFVLMTESGARLAIDTAVARFGLPVTYGDISGTIAGRLEVSDLDLEMDEVSASVEHLAVEWRLLQLIHGRLHIESIEISGVQSVLRTGALGGGADSISETPTEAPRDGDSVLPIDVIVDTVLLRDASLAFTEVAEAYEIDLDAAGTVDAFTVDGRLTAEHPEVGTVELEISGVGSYRGIEFSKLNADVLGGRLISTASLAWSPSLEWQADFRADSLVPANVASSPADWPGQLSLRGSTEGSAGDTLAAQIQLDTVSGVLRNLPVSGRASASIRGSHYSVSGLDLDWGPVVIRGEGEFGERLQAAFELEAADLSVALPDSRGSVSIEGRLGGTRSAPRIDASLAARSLQVAGLSVDDADADVHVNWTAGGANEVAIQASGVQVAGRSVELVIVDATGSKEEHNVSLRAEGEESNVSLAAAGGVRGEAWIGVLEELAVDTEQLGRWALEGTAPVIASQDGVDVAELCMASSEGRLCADGAWDSSEGWHANASVEQVPLALSKPFLPDGLALDGLVTGNLHAAASETRPVAADVALRTGVGSVAFSIGDTTQSITFDNAELVFFADSDTTVGRLSIEIGDDSIEGTGQLRAEVRLSALSGVNGEPGSGSVSPLLDGGRIALFVDEMPMSLLDFLLPGGATIGGTLDGKLEALTEADGSVTAEAEFRPGPGEIIYSSGGSRQTLSYEQGSIVLRVDENGLDGDWSLAWGDPRSSTYAAFSGDVRLPDYTNLDQDLEAQRLEARAEGGWDLAVVDALSEAFSGSTGRLDLNLSASGTVSEPRLTGEVSVRGQTNLTDLGLQLSEIELIASADAARHLQVEGHVISGNGRITIEGTSPPIPSAESPGRITLKGESFLAAQTEQVRLEVSPDIEVLLTGKEIQVSGDVTIPTARIQVLEIPESAEPISRDVVIVGEEQDRRDLPIRANVRVILGDAVSFQGFGFTSQLLGTIAVSESPGAPTQGSGEIELREGIYRGYGQNLQIDPGRLVFAGPLDNPALDVRAYRTATDRTRAGLLLRGTLQEPDVQVWSDPVMSQSEALSYMLFGRSMEQGSEADQANAATAAAALGGSMLAMSMASQVGLDEARIETGSKRSDAAFVAGKYLSPRLYVAYGIGLYEPINTLRIRYLLSPKFTLQTITGDRTATDILYRIER